MSSPTSPAELSARLDALLVDFFTTFADIRSVRLQLSSSMSDGFYNLSLAQHESPLLPLDQSSYAGRDMTATTTITHSAGKGKAAATSDATNEPIIFCLNQQRIAASTSSSATASSSSPIRPGVFTAHLSARERKLDALIAQRGQLNDTIEQQIDQSIAAADIATSTPPAIPHLPSQPLMWFGLLTPQPLTAAQQAFQQAMERVARLAALHDRLRVVEEEWMSTLQQKDRAVADERIKAAERWKEDSEKKVVEEDDDEHGGEWRKRHEESKEQEVARGKSSSSGRKLGIPQRNIVDEPSKDADVAEAMQSLTINKNRKKDT